MSIRIDAKIVIIAKDRAEVDVVIDSIKWLYNTDDQQVEIIEHFYLPACDRDDCRYYKAGKEFMDKCSECLENCQRLHLEGFDHFESK